MERPASKKGRKRKTKDLAEEELRAAKRTNARTEQTSAGGVVTAIPIRDGLRNEPVPVERELQQPYWPKHLFQLHTLAAFIGVRGSGKTNAVVLLTKAYLDAGSFNRVFILSPTYESNPIFRVLGAKRKDVYMDLERSADALRDIETKIIEDFDRYEKYLAYEEAYKRWKRGKATELDEELLHKYQFRRQEKMDMPSPVIVIDDMSHTDIYSERASNPFINLCLRHRHRRCSIFMCVQNYRSRGGLPKCLRENIRQFFIWRTQDSRALESIWSEFANIIDYERFLSLYHAATDPDPHNFLTVDLNAIDKQVMFRRNFDEILVP